MMITKNQAIETFRALIQEGEDFIENSSKVGKPIWDGFERWRTASVDAISVVFGEGSRNLLDFRLITYAPSITERPPKYSELIYYLVGLKIAKEKLEGMLFTIQVWWPEEPSEWLSPIIFIAHGGKSRGLLQRLKDFLLALRASPVVIEELPNLGKSVLDKINHYMDYCNSGIALITAEDILTTGEIRGRPNVDHEIGMMQKSNSINSRIIYLKEDKVNLPSNYREKTWISFKKENFGDVLIKILFELRSFGFII